MIGICYFADKNNEYFAEAQVRAIMNGLNDQVMLIKENTEPNGYKIDAMLEEAAKKKCSEVVLLTEECNYNELSQAVPQIYGDMFENIDVVPENFTRIHEAAPQAQTPQQQTVQSNVQVQKQAVPSGKPSNGTTFIFCDQLFLDVQEIKNWYAAANKAYIAAQNAGSNDIRLCPITVDSAHIEGAAFKALAEAFPKSVNASFTEIAKKLDGDAPDFSLQTDATSVMQAIIMKAGQRKAEQQEEQSQQQNNTLQTINSINIYAPGQFYNYFVNAAKSVTIPVNVMQLGGPFENKSNQKIVNLFQILRDTNKELKAGNKEEDWIKVQQNGANDIDMQTIKYIQVIYAAMKSYDSGDHKKPQDRVKKESELEKLLQAELKQLSGYDNIKKDWQDSIFGKGLEVAEKFAKAVKDDAKQKEVDDKKGMFDEKKTGNRNNKNIYLWEHYNELRKLIIGK